VRDFSRAPCCTAPATSWRTPPISRERTVLAGFWRPWANFDKPDLSTEGTAG
jgi:hypothetical protein